MRRWLVSSLVWGLVLAFHSGEVAAEKVGVPSEQAPLEAPILLKRAAEAVRTQLLTLDQDLSRAAQALSYLELDSEAAKHIIGELQSRRADIAIDISTVSPQGVMVLVAPPAYRSFEGTDISGQEQIRTLLSTLRPVASGVFRTVEGMDAVDMEHPVTGAGGSYRGSVSLLFQPWVLIERCIRPLLEGMPVEIWAMQPDGRIVYDADQHEVGRMLFSDPAYQTFPELLKLGRRIAAEPEGTGAYTYFKAGTSEAVHKDARWVSVMLHGMVWRLVSVHPSKGTPDVPSLAAKPFSWDALRALACEPQLLTALTQGDRDAAMTSLQQAALTHTGIYSLSWVDATAVNRFGYPPENSLFDVDLRTQTDPASVALVRAVDTRTDMKTTGPLVEGGMAHYFLVPVFDAAKYLGSLLWMQKE